MIYPDNGNRSPDWKCERYVLGELDAAEMATIRRLAETDADLASRLADIEASNRAILDSHPADFMARQIERRLAAENKGARRLGRARWPRLRLALVPGLLVAVVGFTLLLDGGNLFEREGVDRNTIASGTTRIKGPAAALNLYRRTEAGSERLDDGTAVREHDLILVQFHGDGSTYGTIFSVDGRGVLTRHHPGLGRQAVLLPTETTALDFSYELDDAPLWEIFVLAYAARPFDLESVYDAVRNSGLVTTPGLPADTASAALVSLRPPDGIEMSVLTLIKDGEGEL